MTDPESRSGLAEMLARLGPCAVEFRYPGASADRALADDAAEDARDVRAWANAVRELG